MADQLSLFGAPAPAPAVTPAHVPEEVRALAASVPEHVRFGTSSWAFPGWDGLVYGGRYSDRVLSRDGLEAYAQHPLLRTVGLDRTYYAPIDREAYAGYAAQVPEDFRFLVKAHEDLLVARFPDHRRYGARAGQENARFLDPDYGESVAVPMLEGLGDRLGVWLLQAPPQDVQAMGGPGRFAALLHRFLEAMPPELPIAVELRNRQLWTRDVLDVLEETGAAPCVAHHPSLDGVVEQFARFARFGHAPLVIRWMLRRGLRYDAAKAKYAPFDRVVDEDDATRDAIAAAAREAALAGRPVTVIVNNKAEGSSPRTVERLARAYLAG